MEWTFEFPVRNIVFILQQDTDSPLPIPVSRSVRHHGQAVSSGSKRYRIALRRSPVSQPGSEDPVGMDYSAECSSSSLP